MILNLDVVELFLALGLIIVSAVNSLAVLYVTRQRTNTQTSRQTSEVSMEESKEEATEEREDATIESEGEALDRT